MGFVVTSALTAVTQVVAAWSKVLFLTHAHRVANLSILLLFKGHNSPIRSGGPQYNGDMVCKLCRTVGHERNLILIVAGYPVDLHTHDNISYWPPFIIERLVNSHTLFMQIHERPHLESKGGFRPPVFGAPFEFKPFLSFRAFRCTGQSHEKCPVWSQV